MGKYVIGLDNGGTVIKAALFDLSGSQIAVASRQTPVITPKPGYTERDMEELWLKNCECVKDVISKSSVSPDSVSGIAVCGHGKGLYLWGKDGKPAFNGIVSTDNRAWEYPQRWKADGTFDKLYPKLCQQLVACQQVSLLAWLKDHEPDIYSNIMWVFSVKDYIRFRLTGEAWSEATDISSSGLMNLQSAGFDAEMLEVLGIPEIYSRLAPLKYSSDNCGNITEEASGLTGLKAGTPVAGGMFDIDGCAVAMDITSPEQLCTITGTWSVNEFINPEPITGTSIAMNSLFAIPGYYLLEECSPTSAGNLEWIIDNILDKSEIPEGVSKYKYINDLVASTEAADTQVYYLPFLYGSNAHPMAKGSFIGLTTYHSRAHMFRAVFEGVAFSHKMHIDKLLSVRKAPEAVRLAGGAANSSLWVQIFADVLGLPVETVSGVSELGAMGAAMAAAVAGGAFSDYQEAAASMVKVNAPVLPDSERTEIYRLKYEKYRAVVEALDTVWDRFQI